MYRFKKTMVVGLFIFLALMGPGTFLASGRAHDGEGKLGQS